MFTSPKKLLLNLCSFPFSELENKVVFHQRACKLGHMQASAKLSRIACQLHSIDEKQETIGDLPSALPAEEGNLEPVMMPHNEQEWPKDWRAYAACFAGFCGMALCW